MNALTQLIEYGQSYWLDNLTRDMIESGELEQRVQQQGLRGVTSNPKIFEEAIAGSNAYDEQLRQLAGGGHSAAEIYRALTTTDIQRACDILRPVYDRSEATDGFVSLEVSPHLAYDAEASVQEARELHGLVARPNLLIKIPATLEGLVAVEQLLFEGINVNITLLFGIARYEAVAQAYMRALERRREAGQALAGIASVASFFLSRIDVLMDPLLRQHRLPDGGLIHGVDPDTLLGKSAVANAKLAYRRFREIMESERWKALAAAGAHPQRLLWASTSTKNPHYRDVMYVEPLIGPYTVNTLPNQTIAAFADHGAVDATLERDLGQAQDVLHRIARLGIDFDQVTQQLENEGIQKFIQPYDALLQLLDHKRQALQSRQRIPVLQDMARKLRREVIQMTTEAGSGHPTSCLSAADLMSALFFEEMRWDPSDPHARNVDTFVLSKGHAAPILWAALHEAGASHEDLMSLRKFGSSLEGHPTPASPWVKVATGSLGQGLAACNGIALANRLDGIDARVYCLLGDAECSEGSVWEAAQFASLQKLGNLVAIVDLNALGQSGPTPYRHDTEVFVKRFESFGWKTLVIDGHDMAQILDALAEARHGGPVAIIAKTIKGKGVSFLEGMDGWHGKALKPDDMQRALAELGDTDVRLQVKPRRVGEYSAPQPQHPQPIRIDYQKGEQVATREGYGRALEKLGGVLPEVTALDGDVKNSTGAAHFAQHYPQRFFEGYIAEQNMAGTALGLASCGKIPYAATFACFLSRAYDFIRMAGHSRPPHLVFCGSHAGISIGEDGPSQMGLEDIAMFRAVYGSTILYPSDAVSAEHLTEEAAHTDGIVYIRTTRPKTPVIYDNDETFPVGGSKVLRSSANDQVAIVAAGITVHEALTAYEHLREKGIAARVIDAYSVKPVDVDTLTNAARDTGHLIVVEDHWCDGGLGDAVSSAVGSLAPVDHLAVSREPRSGTERELLDRYGISNKSIEDKVMQLVA